MITITGGGQCSRVGLLATTNAPQPARLIPRTARVPIRFEASRPGVHSRGDLDPVCYPHAAKGGLVSSIPFGGQNWVLHTERPPHAPPVDLVAICISRKSGGAQNPCESVLRSTGRRVRLRSSLQLREVLASRNRCGDVLVYRPRPSRIRRRSVYVRCVPLSPLGACITAESRACLAGESMVAPKQLNAKCLRSFTRRSTRDSRVGAEERPRVRRQDVGTGACPGSAWN